MEQHYKDAIVLVVIHLFSKSIFSLKQLTNLHIGEVAQENVNADETYGIGLNI